MGWSCVVLRACHFPPFSTTYSSMLRSAGYFSGVPCPAEQKNGCQRPYCPFRHTSKRSKIVETFSDFANIDTTIEKIKNEIRGISSAVDDGWNPLQNDTYEPAPYIHESSSKSILPYARGPTGSKQKISKNIYQSSSLGHPSTDMEYDPVVNYSTTGRTRHDRCVNKVSPDDESECNIPTTSRSEEDTDSVTCFDLYAGDDPDDERFVIDEGDDKNVIAEIFGEDSGKEDCDEEASVIDSSDKHSVIVLSSGDSDGETVDLSKKKEKIIKPSKLSKKHQLAQPNNVNDGQLSTKMSKKSKHSSKLLNKPDTTKTSKKRKRENSDEKQSKKVVKLGKKVHAKVKESATSQKVKKITSKNIDPATITKYVNREEIKQLEEELATSDPYRECLKIFKDAESQPIKEKKISTPTTTIPVEDVIPKPFKQRVAHVNASTSAENLRRPTASRHKRPFSTPSQTMMKRLDIIEQEEAERFLSGKPAKRIAHSMSNKMTAVHARNHETRVNLRKLEDKIAGNKWYPNETTVCGTAAKGTPRIAHESKDVVAIKNGSDTPPRPRIAIGRFSKVPANIRQRYLTCFIDECLRICNKNHEKAYSMAVTKEEECKTRSTSKSIYLSLAASTLKRLREKPSRDTSQVKPKVKPPKPTTVLSNGSRKTMSHDKLLITNTKKCKGGYTIQKKEEKTKLSPGDLYEKMCRYIMTHSQLDENAYPRPSDVPGKAEFRIEDKMKPFNTSEKKVCVRCGKEFYLNKKGKFAKVQECIYHWGRAYMTRVGKGWEKRYSCCQERVGVEGCSVCDTHVHADNKLERNGYVRTLLKSPPPDGNCGIFTLDCEMSYTTNGLELTRVSVLDVSCDLVYDTFVQPSGRVLDYNTRWSGITEEHLNGVKTTIRDVQATFLSKFSSDTILMGHSLESDLVALRIIHETVVDTAIVFPHKRGFPYKRSLKNVASENLGLIIQSGAAEGHDSAEDAAACMKLMLWKIEEDCKVSSKS